MDRYAYEVRLTPAARELLRPGEALVIDWHRRGGVGPLRDVGEERPQAQGSGTPQEGGPDLRCASHLSAPGGTRGQPRCQKGPGPSTLYIRLAEGLRASGGYGMSLGGVGKSGAAFQSRAVFFVQSSSEWRSPPLRAKRQRTSRGCGSPVALPRASRGRRTRWS